MALIPRGRHELGANGTEMIRLNQVWWRSRVGQSFIWIEAIDVVTKTVSGLIKTEPSEITIERAVLLDHEDDVFELLGPIADSNLHGDLSSYRRIIVCVGRSGGVGGGGGRRRGEGARRRSSASD